MNATSILMNISNAIANYPRLELVLAITIVGWIATSWALRRGSKKQNG